MLLIKTIMITDINLAYSLTNVNRFLRKILHLKILPVFGTRRTGTVKVYGVTVHGCA